MKNANTGIEFILQSMSTKQDGAVEACWAHNPEVGRSKLPPANVFGVLKTTNQFL